MSQSSLQTSKNWNQDKANYSLGKKRTKVKKKKKKKKKKRKRERKRDNIKLLKEEVKHGTETG